MARKRTRSRGGDDGLVSRRTAIGLLLAGGAGFLGLQGTGAFTAATGERPFTVGTAGDDAALLGINRENPTGEDGETVTLLTLTNQSGDPFNQISVTVRDTGSTRLAITNIESPHQLTSGESGSIEGTLSCTGEVSDVPVELEIDVSGPGGSVTATREIEVSCDRPAVGPEITAVQWQGGGINPIASPEDTDITIDVWYYDGRGQPGAGPGGSDEFGVECDVRTETNSNIQADLPGQANTHVAVYVHESDESWHHPDFDPDTGELDGWDNNADGLRWGDGSIQGAFDVTCEE